MTSNMKTKRRLVVATIAIIGVISSSQKAQCLETFSEGMEVPETISKVPVGFGAFEGDFFVPDPGFNSSTGPDKIWIIPAAGGPPTEFVIFPQDEGDFGPRGGLFLPDDFGTIGGRYLTNFRERLIATGDAPQFQLDELQRIVTIDNTGSIEDFVSFEFEGPISERPDPRFMSLTTPLIAPDGFGALGGQLIYTDSSDGVVSIDQNGNVGPLLFDSDDFTFPTPLGDIVRVRPWGAVFAPDGFGAVGGSLLVGDSSTTTRDLAGFSFPLLEVAEILSIQSDGTFEVFATIPMSQAQLEQGAGLRQMSFVPPGFGDLSGLLLVSVSGNFDGGGSLGRLLALDESGDIVMALRVGSEFDKFDPRGIFFTEDARILISDASDPILIASIDDFIVVPEPTGLLLMMLAAPGLLFARRRQQK